MAYENKELSKAIKGRKMSTRDYTIGRRFKSAERKVKDAVGLGLVNMIAIGSDIVGDTSAYAESIGKNIESHKQLEEGAEAVWASSPEGQSGMSFDESGFKGASTFDKLFTSAGEKNKVFNMGDKSFSASELINVGKVDPVTRNILGVTDSTGKSGSLWDKYGTKYEEALETSKSVIKTDPNNKGNASKPDDKSGTQVIKNTNQQQQKQNAAGGQPPEPIDFKLPDGTVVKTGSPEHKKYLANFKTKAQKAAELPHLKKLNQQKELAINEPYKAELDALNLAMEDYEGGIRDYVKENPQYKNYKDMFKQNQEWWETQ